MSNLRSMKRDDQMRQDFPFLAISAIFLSYFRLVPDLLVSVIGIIGSFVFLFISPFLHIVDLFKTKQYPEPKTIVITGASSGIGRALALEYAGKGKTLALTGRNNERLQEVATLCIEKGAYVETTTIDVTNRDDFAKWLIKIDKFSAVDLLIANAGVSEAIMPKNETYEDKVYQLTDINVYGVLNTVLPLLESFRKRQHGQIVMTGSLSTYTNYLFPAYVGSKGWVGNYASTLRQELSGHGIGVTLLAPGIVETPMTGALGSLAKPFMISPEASARAFKAGIAENRAFVTDNYPTFALVTFIGSLPLVLRDSLVYLVNIIYPAGAIDTIGYSVSRDLTKKNE
eukprot:gene11524-13449_t